MLHEILLTRGDCQVNQNLCKIFSAYGVIIRSLSLETWISATQTQGIVIRDVIGCLYRFLRVGNCTQQFRSKKNIANLLKTILANSSVSQARRIVETGPSSNI